MRWNVLIGLFVLLLALLQLGIDALTYFDPDRGMLGYGDMLFGGTAAVGLVLSYPLLRGRNWARVALIAVLSCCGIGVTLLVPFSFIANHWIFTRLVIALDGASTVCFIVFFITVLRHAEVRRVFTQTI
jgi:hypothetical protein